MDKMNGRVLLSILIKTNRIDIDGMLDKETIVIDIKEMNKFIEDFEEDINERHLGEIPILHKNIT